MERVGAVGAPRQPWHQPDRVGGRARSPRTRTAARSRVRCTNTARAALALNFTPATLDKTMATLTHRVHLNDVPEVVPTANWNYNAAATALTLTGGFVANDIYEFKYIARDPEIAGLGFAAVRDLNSWIKYGTAAERQPAAQLRHADLYGNLVATRTVAERLSLSRVQRRRKRQKGPRWHHELDLRRQWHQHELPVLAVRPHGAQPAGSPLPGEPVPVRQRDRRPIRIPGRPTAVMRSARRPTPARSGWRSIPPTSTG